MGCFPQPACAAPRRRSKFNNHQTAIVRYLFDKGKRNPVKQKMCYNRYLRPIDAARIR
jgi:hypothetical protein